MKNLKKEVEEFEAMNLDKNSDMYKDTKEAIDGEIDNGIDSTQEKLTVLGANEKLINDKKQANKDAIKSDTINELQKIDVALQVAQLNPFAEQLAEFETRFNNIVYDLDNAKDNKQARSDQRTIGSVVAKLDKKYSEIAEPINEVRSQLLSKRKSIKDDLREVQSKIKDQITSYDDAKREHQEMLENKILCITQYTLDYAHLELSIPELSNAIESIELIIIDSSFEDFEEKARYTKKLELSTLNNTYDALAQQEKDAKELEDLRAKQAIQEQKDHDAKIAKEAADNARIEAERVAKEKIDFAKSEALRIEQEKELAVTNERLRIENNQRIADEKEAAENAKIEAKKANQNHRAKVHKAVKESLMKAHGMDCKTATAIVKSIISGDIQHVGIEY